MILKSELIALTMILLTPALSLFLRAAHLLFWIYINELSKRCMSTNPTVVMDIKLHQNPSSTPEIKGRGN